LLGDVSSPTVWSRLPLWGLSLDEARANIREALAASLGASLTVAPLAAAVR
jgi:hypothetical protein